MMLTYPPAVVGNGREISRLLTAAVVNQRFCNLLLSNPASALDSGYNGETFSLASEEKDLILSIQANSLSDFARQLAGRRGVALVELPVSRLYVNESYRRHI